MAALRIATHGRAGAVSALGIGSFGRIGKVYEILLIPVDYTPFTIVTVLPSEIKDVEIEDSQLITIITRSETGFEIEAYMMYVIVRDAQTMTDIFPSQNIVEVTDPEDEVEI